MTPDALPLEPMFLAFGWEPTHTGVPSKRRLFAGVDSCMGEVFKPRQRAFYFFPGFRRGVSDWEAPGLKRKNYYAIVSCNAEALPPDKSGGSHPNQGPHLNARGRIASGYPAFGFTSSPNIVRCYHESRLRVNQNCHFGTQAAVGECWSQSSDAGASNGCEFQNSLLIHCYSLFFLADKNRKFP